MRGQRRNFALRRTVRNWNRAGPQINTCFDLLTTHWKIYVTPTSIYDLLLVKQRLPIQNIDACPRLRRSRREIRVGPAMQGTSDKKAHSSALLIYFQKREKKQKQNRKEKTRAHRPRALVAGGLTDTVVLCIHVFHRIFDDRFVPTPITKLKIVECDWFHADSRLVHSTNRGGIDSNVKWPRDRGVHASGEKYIWTRREPRGVGWDDDHEKVDPRFWPNEQRNWTEEEEKSARSKLRKTGLGRQVRCDSRFQGKYLHRK